MFFKALMTLLCIVLGALIGVIISLTPRYLAPGDQ